VSGAVAEAAGIWSRPDIPVFMKNNINVLERGERRERAERRRERK
ncbi:hypothetical protein A2U01_0061949, partial [Trifolium medium]|nr:hypothetical protein [Trifolium medium]